MNKPSTPRRRGVTVTLGKTEVTKVGEVGFSWSDVYHAIMSMTWSRFFAVMIGSWLLVNLVFATRCALGPHPCINSGYTRRWRMDTGSWFKERLVHPRFC